MVDLLIAGGTVVTMDDDRTVIDDGAVAVSGREIAAVGERGDLTAAHDPDRVVDATGHAVLPGFISAHAHVSDVLLRGRGNERALHDWLFNVNNPGKAAMTPTDYGTAAALYATEALEAGLTTVVDNAGGGEPGLTLPDPCLERKLRAYEASGIRAAYAREFIDRPIAADDRFERFLTEQFRAEGRPVRLPEPMGTDAAIADVERLMDAHAGRGDGRITVWPAPIYPWAVSREGLDRAAALARRRDVMSSTHVSEVVQQERHQLSSVEYLHGAGYLGPHVQLGHCVHVDERDVRLLARTDTRVAHNVLTNLALGSGIAPVPTMLDHGVTVGIGTDNSSASDTVNPVDDARFAALVHKAHRRDPAATTAERALEMLTIDAARAIGRGDDLGAIEPGRLADLVLLDLDRPHLTPCPDVPAAIVYRARGTEIDTVVCNGEVVVRDGRARRVADEYPDLTDRAREAAARIADDAGLDDLRGGGWESSSTL